MKRIANVARLYIINTRSMLWVPVLILVGAWLITIFVYQMIPSGEVTVSGGQQAPLWYTMALGITGLNLLFPFSQALGITRREFVLGSCFAAIIYSAVMATVFAIGGLIEQATNNFNLGGYFFYLSWMWNDAVVGAWLLNFSISLLFFTIGFVLAAIYKRYGMFWLMAILVALGLALVAALWFITKTNSWMRLFTWFAGFGPLSTSLALLLIAVVLGGCAYLTLRRMVVR